MKEWQSIFFIYFVGKIFFVLESRSDCMILHTSLFHCIARVLSKFYLLRHIGKCVLSYYAL